MKRSFRIGLAASAFTVLALGVSALIAAPPTARPAPKPPVQCGCICPDGSFITTHAKNSQSCGRACDAACESASGEF